MKRNLLAVLAAFACVCFFSPAEAHADVVAVEAHDGHRYAFMDEPASFAGAQQACEARAMDLVTINSAAEQQWLSERVFRSTPNNVHAGYLNDWVWIGAHTQTSTPATAASSSRRWQWASGQRFKLRALGGAPDAAGERFAQHGAAVALTAPDPGAPGEPAETWRVSTADTPRKFVCESRGRRS